MLTNLPRPIEGSFLLLLKQLGQTGRGGFQRWTQGAGLKHLAKAGSLSLSGLLRGQAGSCTTLCA